MPEIKAPKALASDVMLTMFGIITLPVDILPAKRSQDIRTELVCPTCTDAHKVSQQYVCNVDETHGPITSADAHRAIKVDGTLTKITEEELAALKAPTVPAKTANVRVFDAKDVEHVTMPAGELYRLRAKNNPDAYAMLVEVCSDPKLAFCVEITMREVTKLYRLVTHDGLLTLVGLVRPGEFNEIEVKRADFDASIITRLREFIAEKDIVEPFNAEAFTDIRRQRAEALVEVMRDPNAPKPEPTVVQRSDGSDLMSQLAASLEAVPKKAKPVKKAAKKAAKKSSGTRRRTATART